MKKFLASFFILTQIFATEPKVIEDKTTIPLLTPQLQMRKTEKIELANGLKAILISDPLLQDSAAVLTVNTGSFEDPDDAPGIAHFLEHMLFLGTEKYPEESSYQKFIAENGGETNAYTASDHTSYMFSVHTEGFEEALDRFANFFIHPLFSPSGVNREINAIDQESAKGFNEEDVRHYHVLKAIANKHHPLQRFSTGNKSTLGKVSQETLKAWFEKNYSAGLMHLYVLSPLPLETLKKFVVEDFSAIKNNGKTPNVVTLEAIVEEKQGEIIYIESKKNIQKLSVLFELPKEIYGDLKTKPADLISYVIGHEGKESLLAEIKREGLASGVSSGSFDLGANLSFMLIEIELTKAGLSHPEIVLERLFQAINVLKNTPFPKILFDEYALLLKQKYQNKTISEPFTEVMSVATPLVREDIATFPELTSTLQTLDQSLVQKVLDVLKPELGIYFITSPELPNGNQGQVEPWMGIRYSEAPLPKEWLKALTEAGTHPAITITEPNPYIAKEELKLSPLLVEREAFPFIPAPKSILDTASAKWYYSEDPFYEIPRSWLRFQIYSEAIQEEKPISSALADIYVAAMKDVLSEIIYDAKVADLNVSIDHKPGGIEITLEGYTESIRKFIEPFLQQIVLAPANAEKFEVWKDATLREYENEKQEMPIFQTFDYFKNEIFKEYSQKAQKSAALNKINLETFLKFQRNIFLKTFTKGYITGSLSEEEALDIVPLFETTGKDASELVKNTKIVPLLKDAPHILEAEIPADGNALLLAVQVNEFTPKTRNCQQILEMSLQHEFFAELRTRQQTGYMVMSFSADFYRNLFTFFAIQSNTYTPIELLFRVELFLEQYLRELTTVHIPEEKFIKLKNTLLFKLKEAPKNLSLYGEQQFKLGFEIGNFEWLQERVKSLETLSYAEFTEFVRTFLGRENKQRMAILLKGQIPEENRFEYVSKAIPSKKPKIASKKARQKHTKEISETKPSKKMKVAKGKGRAKKTSAKLS